MYAHPIIIELLTPITLRLQLSFLRDNILINDNVLHTAHRSDVQKVISCLSTCVFPDGKEGDGLYPLTEAKVHLGPPHPSNFGYSHAKRLVDIQNRCVGVITETQTCVS